MNMKELKVIVVNSTYNRAKIVEDSAETRLRRLAQEFLLDRTLA